MTSRRCPLSCIAIVLAMAALALGTGALRAAEAIADTVHAQIAALIAEKDARTPGQRKMDSQLVYFVKQTKNKVAVAAVPSLLIDVKTAADSRVLVDVKATVTDALRAFIAQSGGTIVSDVPLYGALRVYMPPASIEALAARNDVQFVEPAVQAVTNIGTVLSEGPRTHRADTARTTLGVDGSGIKIGVLSNGIDSLTASKANGNLNANATFIAGQASTGDEGTAMMELIQDMLPGAQLVFATGNGGTANMANNITLLQAAGCTVIVDDLMYLNESPFQDQVISQAVTTVSTAGVLYFSSAGNSGNKDAATSGTWEGDFVSGGAAGAPVTTVGSLHSFSGTNFDTVASAGGGQGRVDLFWSDPLGGSTNDYDLFVLDSTGASVLRSSTNIQNGSQDPYENVSTLNVGERIVIVQKTGASGRFLHLDTGRMVLTTSTQGHVRGHNSSGAANAFSVAATDVHNSASPTFFTGGATNPVETFSSDGPRRMFYQPNGTPFTAGNFSSTGGTVLNKPDITAADGAATSVPGFNPFYGTSAAAPHAAAIAAMLESYNSSLTPAQIRTAMTSTALDIGTAGLDRDSGNGIVMALQSLQAVAVPDVLTIVETGLDGSGTVAGPFTPSSGTYTLKNTGATSLNWTIANTQSWNTLSQTSGTLTAGNTVVVTCAFNNATAVLGVGGYSDTITITNTSSGFVRKLSVNLFVQSASTASSMLWDSFTNASSITFVSGTSRTIMGQAFSLSSVNGTSNIAITNGTAYMVSAAAASYTNVRLNVTFWSAASNATSGATAAFSGNLGSFNFDLGAKSVSAGGVTTIPFTLPSTVVMPAQTGGISFKFTADSGAGLVANDNLTPLLRYGANAVAVGTPTAGTAGTWGWYQGAVGQTELTLAGSSFSSFGQPNQAIGFQLQATGIVSTIGIKGNSTTITNGSVTPSLSNATDYGTITVGANTTNTFTINSTGARPLSLTGSPMVTLSGTNAADFTVTTQPTSPVPGTSGSTTFQVKFAPSAGGVRSATVTVINNDATANPFTFAIQGTGFGNYTWNGGNGTWAVGQNFWDLGAWVNGNNATFGKGTDTGGTVTVSSSVNPAAVTFIAPQVGTAYTLAITGTILGPGSGILLQNGAIIRGTGGTINRSVTTDSTGVVWPGASTVAGALSGSEMLTLSALDMTGGGKVKIAGASGTKFQQLVVNGGATCKLSGGTLSLGVTGGTYSFIALTTGTNIIPSAFTTVTVNGNTLASQTSVTIQYLNSSGSQAFPANRVQVTVNGSVTPVKLDSFTAKAEGGGVRLGWHSVSEYQNAGFNVYRRVVGTEEWSKVNDALIAGRLTNADEHTYYLYDWTIPGRYEYRLDSVAISGDIVSFPKLPEPVNIDASGLALSTPSDETFAAVDDSIVAEAQSARVAAVRALFNNNEAGGPALQAESRQRPEAARETPRNSPPLPIIGTFDAAIAARWFSPSRPASSPGYTAAKVVYSTPGVLAIAQASLPGGFDINHVSVTREGKTVPALAIRNGTLYVYGPGYSDDYTDKDVLFLRSIGGNTSVSNVSPATGLFGEPAATSALASVSTQFHDVYFDFSSGFRPYIQTPWFSNQYLTDNSVRTFTLATPFASGESATLTVNVWSMTTDPNDASPDHALQLLINGQPAGQTTWTGGNQAQQLSFTIPAGLLKQAAANTIELVTPALPNVSGQIALLHSLQIDYTKNLDGSAPLTLDNAVGGQIYEVANVSGGAWVVDARFPDRTALVPVQTHAQADGLQTLRFKTNAGGTGLYRVVPYGFEIAPLKVSGRKIAPIRSDTKWLAVGPAQFAAGVQPLVALHNKEGLRGLFVDQEQIFDYFGFGRYGPAAIQNAVRATRPQYLELVGRTTYDYRNYSAANVDPLCPAFLVSTSGWAQTTSDSLFGDLGRGYPEIAIGRLPVNDSADLAGAVNHILHYRGFAAPSGIRAQITALAADPLAGNFPAQSDALTAAHPEFAWQKNYLGISAQTNVDAAAAMRTAANGGADMLVFLGHGSARVLGDSNIPEFVLNMEALPDSISVRNWSGNVPFLQGTCTANWMAKDEQNYHSIAIQALTQPQGGISASIGTSTYMNSDATLEFLDQLLKRANRGGQRWGVALMEAQQWAAKMGSGFYADLNTTEQLFGDPAMPVFSAPSQESRGKSLPVKF